MHFRVLPGWILGAREEWAFVKSYAPMVRNLQITHADESVYVKHGLRIELSTDCGKTLSALPSELFNIYEGDAEMEDFTILDPRRYGKASGNYAMDPEHFQAGLLECEESLKSRSKRARLAGSPTILGSSNKRKGISDEGEAVQFFSPP